MKDNLLTDALAILILLFFLFVGLTTYTDYGVSWDEECQIVDVGKGTSEFIQYGNIDQFLQNPEKYHGPAFELLLNYVQILFSKYDYYEVLPFRHLINFLFYWIAGLFMYLLLRSRFNNSVVVLIGLIWYFIMPRIFADAFFNSKDIPVLCMTIISLWSLNKIISKPKPEIYFLHGVFCGFLISIRIIGIIIPLLTLFIFAINIIDNLSNNKIKIYTNLFLSYSLFLISTITFTILFWPVLWIDPISHFVNAWKEMSKFHWSSEILYLGQLIHSQNIPWHYNFVWIGITTPLIYLITFLLSTCYLLLDTIKNGISGFKKNQFEIICIALFFGPLFMIIFFKSVVYDGWRHVFFIYSAFIIISMFGLNAVINYFKLKNMNPIFVIIPVLLSVGFTAYEMIKYHPYNNVYFNKLSGVNNHEGRFKFELDYWGLSYKEALQKLLKSTGEANVKVKVGNWPGYLNEKVLTSSERNRLQLVDEKESEYLITTHRWETSEINWYYKIDSINVYGVTISSTYLLHK